MFSFKTYVVGGAVRDTLLGLPVKDKDYVVVGATPEQMRQAGFTPVGKDFPVFLHPQTHEEYALARTERKTAPGYAGFSFHASPEVTLEEDLLRRDLTINAIAQESDGKLVDPYGGQQDIEARIFRHISPAFAEDPVRILRIARFSARFADFSIAPETLALMQRMVSSGEVDALVPERVWQEVSRGLMEARPSRMFEVLRACGALARLMPEIDELSGALPSGADHPQRDAFAHAMRVIDVAASEHTALPVRFAALVHDLDKNATPAIDRPLLGPAEPGSDELADQLCRRLKLPNEVRDLALLAAREHGNVRRAMEMNATTVVSLLERCDAFRRSARFADLLKVSECDQRGRTAAAERPCPQTAYCLAALAAAQQINAGAIAADVTTQNPERPAERIAAAIHAARVEAVRTALGLSGSSTTE